MSDSMDEPRVRIRASFKQAFLALWAMPLLSGTAIVAIGAITYFLSFLATADAPQGRAAITSVPAILDYVLSDLVIASILIAVHRYILFDEIRDRPIWAVPANYMRFAIWLLVVNLGVEIVSRPIVYVLEMIHPWAAVVGLGLSWITRLIIDLRMLLIFPALAAQAPGVTFSAAWGASRGHVGSFVWTGFLCAIFGIVLSVGVGIIWAIIAFVVRQSNVTIVSPQTVQLLISLLIAPVVIYASAVGAVIASRFYQIYGPSRAW